MSKQEDYHFIIETKIRTLLKSAGISVKEASERIGMSREYFYKMLKPEKLTVDWLVNLCEKCELDVGNFLNVQNEISVMNEPAQAYGFSDKVKMQEKLIEEMSKTNKSQEDLIVMLKTEIERIKA